MSASFIFFSGKGGVGKTSMACATAVHHADHGRRTLIVTTDPASNLADVFEQPIGHKITPIEGVANLRAMEIDADRATEEYKDRALAPVRALFPPEVVQVMEEQLSGPCTAEVAAFDRFVDFLDTGREEQEQPFEVVVFDTAPTGHTLRLLELPVDWSRHIEEAAEGSGQTCLGPVATIQESKVKYDRAVELMRDPALTSFVFVLQPEATPIKETRRAVGELSKLGIDAHQLIVNGVIPQEAGRNPFLAQRIDMQSRYLSQIGDELRLPTQQMPLLDEEIKGVERLRYVAGLLYGGEQTPANRGRHLISDEEVRSCSPSSRPWSGAPSDEVVPRLMPANGRGRTLFFAGKGGVGKTALSCVTAVWLARHGYRTLLLTTDPAAHIGDVLDHPVGDEVAPVDGVENLWAVQIDPKAAAEAYKTRILEEAREAGRGPESLKAMAEELESPCTEEMAAFDRFVDYASLDQYDVLVFDTAPTGHTLRLLELPVDWSQQLDVKLYASAELAEADAEAKAQFGEVIDMMRDPQRSTFAFVTYPESTPIVEAWRAVKELRTVGIETGMVVANQVLPPEECTTEYYCRRSLMQARYLEEMDERFSAPILATPLLAQEVKGLDVLTDLGERIYGNGRR